MSLKPFTVDPSAPNLQTTASMTGVALKEVATLVPQALKEAQGQIDGHLAGHWSAATGAEPGEGVMLVSGNLPTILRLAESPGFLSAHVPTRIALLPSSFGPLARWLSAANPAYGALRDIEMGNMPLKVDTLNVQLYPDGRDAPRTAHIEIVAHPVDASAVKLVTFTINVSGPLDQVMRLGMKQRLRMSGGSP